jgi:hypothetical protein
MVNNLSIRNGEGNQQKCVYIVAVEKKFHSVLYSSDKEK